MSVMRRKTTMANYKMRKIRKRGKQSQTPGKQKGEFCQATPIDKYMARSNRSYKHPGYADWCKRKPGIIGSKKSDA